LYDDANDVFETQNEACELTKEHILALKWIVDDNITNPLTLTEESQFKMSFPNFDLKTGKDISDDISRINDLARNTIKDIKHERGYAAFTFVYSNMLEANGKIDLINSTVLRHLGFNTRIVSLRNGQWRPARALYAQRYGAEIFRIRFSTLKHSLLLINPINQDEFKKIETHLDFEKVKNYMRGARPMDIIFRFGSTLSRQQITIDLANTGIVESKKLDSFSHTSIFTPSFFSPKTGGRSYAQDIDLATLADSCEKLVYLDSPFLFFVIDDPTGAILMMGRLAGYKKLK